MLSGKHIFAVFLDRNMTLAMREKKEFMPTFGALQAMDEIYLSSNRLVFAVDTYSCQYDPCSWSKSWRVMEMLTMKGKKQDDKKRGGGRKWPYETAVSCLKGQQRSRQFKKKKYGLSIRLLEISDSWVSHCNIYHINQRDRSWMEEKEKYGLMEGETWGWNWDPVSC